MFLGFGLGFLVLLFQFNDLSRLLYVSPLVMSTFTSESVPLTAGLYVTVSLRI